MGGHPGVVRFLGQELVFGGSLSLVFSYVFSIVALVGMIYSLRG